jgi:hypothetical protein
MAASVGDRDADKTFGRNFGAKEGLQHKPECVRCLTKRHKTIQRPGCVIMVRMIKACSFTLILRFRKRKKMYVNDGRIVVIGVVIVFRSGMHMLEGRRE